MKSWSIKLVITLAAVFAPAAAMVGTSLTLVVFDLITGVWAAKKAGVPITSAGIRRTITKMFVYESAILLGFLTQQYLTGSTIPVANIISGLIGVTELISVIENLNVIGDNQLLKSVLEKLNSVNK